MPVTRRIAHGAPPSYRALHSPGLPQRAERMVRELHSQNALLTPWPLRLISRKPRDRSYPRLGAQAVAHLLQVELELVEKRDSYDVDWFSMELLRRLRWRFFSDTKATDGERGEFDLWAGMLDFDGVDISCVLFFGKRRYREILLEILRELYDEEHAGSEISDIYFRKLKIPWLHGRA